VTPATPGPACASTTADLLTRGAIALHGRLPWSSNATFLVQVSRGGERALAVYKPQRGERPLWDFPRGLDRREVAAYRLSELLGWGLVPPTFPRADGPYGRGSVQLFVDADPTEHYFTLRERPEHRPALARLCAFDLVANNADRKGGHCLLGRDGRVYAIDNGLCFHPEPKLRTVIWDFAGEPVPEDVRRAARRLAREGLPPALAELLDAEERRALLERARALGAARRFPDDPTGLQYPWPLV
jgi:uncharacterized repeat protein (TIGR03843 family)